MGVVFSARRASEGVEQRAAIKFLSLPVFDAAVAERFVREARMLARLNHPGICRLRDWGRAEQGWPYLVLDLIEGRPIDEAAADWSKREKIALMVRVAETVAAAHREMIVHLDLKPDNIVVDAQRNPILLDFGVARVLADDGAAVTATLTRWLTPNYASPEQLRGESASASADIYALGVLLYQLLTGERPYDLSGLSVTDALARLEKSTRPAGIDRSLLPVDLRSVIARAMHPDASRRYASAQSLADDLRAVLAHRPVMARADSPAYRLKKLIQRHPIAAPLGALSVLAIAILAGQLAWQAGDLRLQRDRAEFEATRARAASDLLLGAIQAADPTGTRASATSVDEMLAAAVQRAEKDADDDPLLAAETLLRIADIRRVLGEHAAAITIYDQALALLDTDAEFEPSLRAALLAGQATALRQTEQTDRARELLAAELNRPHPEAHWRVWVAHAQLELSAGNLEVAEQALQQALQIVPESEHHGRALIASSFGLVQSFRGQPAEALRWYERAAAAARRTPVNRETLATILLNTADVLSRQGRVDEALAVSDEALSLRIEMFGPRHVRTVPSYINRAYVLMQAGRFDQALESAYLAAEMERELVGPRTRRMAAIWGAIGLAAERSQDWEKASEAFAEALAIQRQLLPDDHHDLAVTRSNLASALMAQGQFEKPLTLLMKAREVHRMRAQGQPSRAQAIAEVNIAWCYLNLAEPDQALQWARSALDGAEQVIDSKHWLLGHFRNVHADALLVNGRLAEAEAEALAVAQLYESSEIPVRPKSLTDNLDLLQRIAEQSGDVDRAQSYRQRLRALTAEAEPAAP
ncbi:tetratricopeptide repeat protein [Wenzhouxiangella limi]|nr:tetratricopeptide repeat protein [Wenzhouxiangella limi]